MAEGDPAETIEDEIAVMQAYGFYLPNSPKESAHKRNLQSVTRAFENAATPSHVNTRGWCLNMGPHGPQPNQGYEDGEWTESGQRLDKDWTM